MADTISIKIYIPAGLFLEDTATSVTLESSEGQIGILPHHVKYVGLLGTGICEYITPGGQTKKLVVSGGFCNFDNEMLVILADTADLPGTLSPKVIEKEIAAAQEELKSGNTYDPRFAYAQDKLARYQAASKLA